MSSSSSLKSPSKLLLIREGVLDLDSTEWPWVTPQAGQAISLRIYGAYHQTISALTNGHLRAALSVLFGDFLQDRFVDHLADFLARVAIDFVLIAERRVMGHVDALSPMPLDEFTLLQPWMTFNLMHRGSDVALFQKILHLVFGEV